MYFVEIRKRGRLAGLLGPYAQRADALCDGAVLKRPGLDIKVTEKKSKKEGSIKVRANNPAAASILLTLLPALLPLITKALQGRVDDYLRAPIEEQVRILRKVSTFNLPLRVYLTNDARAEEAAVFVAQQLAQHGDELVEGAVQVAKQTANVKANTGRAKKEAKGRRKG